MTNTPTPEQLREAADLLDGITSYSFQHFNGDTYWGRTSRDLEKLADIIEEEQKPKPPVPPKVSLRVGERGCVVYIQLTVDRVLAAYPGDTYEGGYTTNILHGDVEDWGDELLTP